MDIAYRTVYRWNRLRKRVEANTIAVRLADELAYVEELRKSSSLFHDMERGMR